MTISIGIIGARGHVGAELIRLIAGHPGLELAFVGSRELAGQALPDLATLTYEALDADAAASRGADALILALPNGAAANYVAAIERSSPETLIVDLSADYRFDDAWYYGLPELTRGRYAGQRRISNPGCYATAMQLAIAPLRDLVTGPVQCFGVSGYSGAGTTPSERNDPQQLRDNLMPYALVGHLHEREVARQLGLDIEFMPHVAAHFRGISMTVNVHLARPCSHVDVVARFRNLYAGEALIRIDEAAPWVSRNAGRHHAALGGFTLDASGTRLVVVATLDNLLKGAATQALQNLNLALRFDDLAGIPHD